ncbi:hypothetical protein D3OALGA1CA_3350 [Olavius algarvensis associated proteobacterium Delta 3]|nr:hypothetical protein D3OALGB2SA_1474 [Olavius algarvensis associated proteobacterium Delta 3]CAB5132967.1 hypothetical protein D3OALGA1CA_3350 [Olavius algarvensis associated proteobacterium Delta 3]
MTEARTLDQARYIFTTGKIIRDRIDRIINDYLTQMGTSDEYFGLSYPQLHAMMMVRMREQLTMSELAELLEVSPSSASSMVDKLVERGCLVREHSTADRRKVIVTVSEEAKHSISGIEEKLLQLFTDIVEKIGPDTTQKWCDVLKEVKKAL